MPMRISSEDSRIAKRAAVKGEVMCKHSCEHHGEVMDPRLWRNLPQELVELIFAELPLPRILELCECSKAWLTMTNSLALLAKFVQNATLNSSGYWDGISMARWTTMYDIKSKEWHRLLNGQGPFI